MTSTIIIITFIISIITFFVLFKLYRVNKTIKIFKKDPNNWMVRYWNENDDHIGCVINYKKSIKNDSSILEVVHIKNEFGEVTSKNIDYVVPIYKIDNILEK